MKTLKIDFKNPDLYINGIPHDLISSVRKTSPVFWNEEDEGGFWSILKHSDIVSISKKPHIFSSANRYGGHRIFDEQEAGVAKTGSPQIGIPFISTDPPLHREYRRLVQPAVSPVKVKAMKEKMRSKARALLNSALDKGKEFDLVESISTPYPLAVLADLFGIPNADIGLLLSWSNAMVGEDDSSIRINPEESARILEEMIEYGSWIFEDRKRNPTNDVLSMLANGLINKKSLSKSDFLASFILLLVGGNETTRNSISHGLIAFTRYPEQWAKLKRNPNLVGNAVKEIIRWSSPVMHMRRTAISDIVVNDQKIKAGDKVVLWYVSGNQDEAVYKNPHKFDIERDAGRHLGFGAGNHICIGNRLAETQLEIILEEIVNLLPNLRVVGEGRRLRSNFINGFLELPVSR